jgi:hypothetical protein
MKTAFLGIRQSGDLPLSLISGHIRQRVHVGPGGWVQDSEG